MKHPSEIFQNRAAYEEAYIRHVAEQAQKILDAIDVPKEKPGKTNDFGHLQVGGTSQKAVDEEAAHAEAVHLAKIISDRLDKRNRHQDDHD